MNESRLSRVNTGAGGSVLFKREEVGAISETTYRVIDLVMQAVYLPAHLWFIVRLIRSRMPSPIWRWFIILVSGLWGIVCGDFIETVLLLFWRNNAVYMAGVIYQLLSTLAATMAFLLWNLYIAGHVQLAENRLFRGGIFAISFATAAVVCTDPIHHLFYEKLILAEPVVHGKLFAPCVFVVYGMLIGGWIISLVHIVRHGEDKVRRALIFSMYPLLPGAANLVRSLTGFTLIDVNPVVMTVCILCLYSMVFKDRYVSVLPASVDQALDQTGSILFTLDPADGTVAYMNRMAKEQYAEAVREIVADYTAHDLHPDGQYDGHYDGRYQQFEGMYAGRHLKVNVSRVDDGQQLLITATDVSEIRKQQEELLSQIRESTELLQELEEKKRNIDAYLDFLYRIPNLKEKWEMLTAAEEESKEAFLRMEDNLVQALDRTDGAQERLNDNLLISEHTIAKIRAAVALLREDM